MRRYAPGDVAAAVGAVAQVPDLWGVRLPQGESVPPAARSEVSRLETAQSAAAIGGLMAKARDWKAEYEAFHGKPEEIAKRASRNAARAKLEEKVGKGAMKGKDTSHKNNNPLDNRASNLKPEKPSTNRARKTK